MKKITELGWRENLTHEQAKTIERHLALPSARGQVCTTSQTTILIISGDTSIVKEWF